MSDSRQESPAEVDPAHDPDCGIPQEFAQAMGLMPETPEQKATREAEQSEAISAAEDRLKVLSVLIPSLTEQYSHSAAMLRKQHLDIVAACNELFGIYNLLGIKDDSELLAKSTVADDLLEANKALTKLVAHTRSIDFEFTANLL